MKYGILKKLSGALYYSLHKSKHII